MKKRGTMPLKVKKMKDSEFTNVSYSKLPTQ